MADKNSAGQNVRAEMVTRGMLSNAISAASAEMVTLQQAILTAEDAQDFETEKKCTRLYFEAFERFDRACRNFEMLIGKLPTDNRS